MRKTYCYQLEPYKGPTSRYTCPRCQKHRQFVRYIHTLTKEPLAHYVGRCNREHKCAYHYTPSEYLAGQKGVLPPKSLNIITKPAHHLPRPISYIPLSLFKATLKNYELNHFITYLNARLGIQKTQQLTAKFYIGTSKHWKGATVFWQIDHKGRIRTGKIMLYDPLQGTRIKTPFKHINWVHQALKLTSFNLAQSLFGAHQLIHASLNQPVALVESEKTAIIATAYWPHFIWMAVGNLNGLTTQRCASLQGRKVILFPDAGAYELWKQKAEELSKPLGIKVKVSNWLEEYVSSAELEQGVDLADYLLQIPYPN